MGVRAVRGGKEGVYRGRHIISGARCRVLDMWEGLGGGCSRRFTEGSRRSTQSLETALLMPLVQHLIHTCSSNQSHELTASAASTLPHSRTLPSGRGIQYLQDPAATPTARLLGRHQAPACRACRDLDLAGSGRLTAGAVRHARRKPLDLCRLPPFAGPALRSQGACTETSEGALAG